MNGANVKEFTTALRAATVPQCEGALSKFMDEQGTVGFCCLGYGSKIAGVPRETISWNYEEYTSLVDLEAWTFGVDHAVQLAPLEFVVWLGLVDETVTGSGFDINLDWGPLIHLDTQGRDGWNALTLRGLQPHPFSDDTNIKTLAGLNDGGFTFAQIADLIDYLGLLPIGVEA